MHLIPLTQSQWRAERRAEANESGLRVIFVGLASNPLRLAALFFNGEFLCYSRMFDGGAQ